MNPSQERSSKVIAVFWLLWAFTQIILGMLALWKALARDISANSFLFPCPKPGGLSESLQLEVETILVNDQSVILLTNKSSIANLQSVIILTA
jgi:hypothetical protein